MKILVTAGPTREFLDPVRFLSNRSSGKMGYALAERAAARGHTVLVVSGPVCLPPPGGITVVPVVSAEDMLREVAALIEQADALIMAAAVADFRPRVRSPLKLKKATGSAALELEPTPDILERLRPLKGERVFVGFAAETDHILEEARRKLHQKGLDLIVANDITRPGAGFDVDTNEVTLIGADGTATSLPLLTKPEVAERILDRVEALWGRQESRAPGGRGQSAHTPDPVGLARGVSGRLARQIEFVREIDKLKSVYRRTLLMDGSRYENDAEHSWHLAMLALVLREHATASGLEFDKALKMVLIHDLVEIDAGDTYCYDEQGQKDRAQRERTAADRVFGILPPDQCRDFRALWEEFEARQTPEARFAAALDRLQPLLHNYCTHGRVWRQHGVDAGQVMDRNRHIAEGAHSLWDLAERLIRDSVDRGYLSAPQRRGRRP